MKDLNDVPEFSKYFQVIKPSEIDINKEDIFYRDKYNEVINYLKMILSNHEDALFQKYLEPSGAILVNINPGTDVIEYIKLITKNYYLDLIELNDKEIFKTPDDFVKSFPSIIKGFRRIKESENSGDNVESSSDITSQKRVLLIDQRPDYKQKFEINNLLEEYVSIQQVNNTHIKFIDLNLVLVWITHDLEDVKAISHKIYNEFDLFIKIPILDKIERETILRDYLERDPKIVFDINMITNYTEKWEVKDIKQLLKVGIFKHFINSELNETSNEITDILIDLILSGEYIPYIRTSHSQPQSESEINDNISHEKQIDSIQISDKNEKIRDIGGFVDDIRESRISDFMLNQLYENAASMNYNELLLIIDKLNKKEPLEDNDRKVLAKYPFVLNDSPALAQINLEKAKKRVDLIKQAFGK